MKQQDKELLLKDLCARLLCGIKCEVHFKDSEGWKTETMTLDEVSTFQCFFISDNGSAYSNDFKPYLRPMSSMTKKEECEWNFYSSDSWGGITEGIVSDCIDWLNAHHFDYRDLIPKGLALEAPEGMYKKGE